MWEALISRNARVAILENVPLGQPPDSWLKSFEDYLDEDMINTTVICEFATPNSVAECLRKKFIALGNPFLSEQPVIATERGYDERGFDTCQNWRHCLRFILDSLCLSFCFLSSSIIMYWGNFSARQNVQRGIQDVRRRKVGISDFRVAMRYLAGSQLYCRQDKRACNT